MKTTGTISRGIKAPIIKSGDDLVEIVAKSVIEASKEGKFNFNDRDIVAVTEAVVARSEGNYATIDDIASDVRQKTGGKTVGLVFPILSRNRFSLLLQGIAKGVEKLIVQLSYPNDEVGNPLIDLDAVDAKGVNPYSDNFTQKQFEQLFGNVVHPFTNVNYIEMYKKLGGENCEIVISNRPEHILKYTSVVINADIHTRRRTKRILLEKGAEKVISLDELLDKSVNGSGYNPFCGLLGSNMATDTSIKLFPRSPQEFVDKLSAKLFKETGKKIEVMVYGDGAFKDPVGGIWELADPVVSPAYTQGLAGTPNELKLKYLADNKIAALSGEEAVKEMKRLIKEKGAGNTDDMVRQGTTPRRLTDLLGSLCDLTSGSGDKGTPIVLIQNYFNDFSAE